MSIAKQLFQLQELELALEANEQAQTRLNARLGESQAVLASRARLAVAQKRYEELAKQQKSTEWEIEDLTTRIKTIERRLYDGKTTNPKELTNLQHEVEDLKRKRGQLEDKLLALMEDADATRHSITTVGDEMKKLEAQWRVEQSQLTAELTQLKTAHTDTSAQKQALLPEIEMATLELYRELRKRKGVAVARVEQGICRGCRITLPNSDLQAARGGGMTRCSSCGRILFLA